MGAILWDVEANTQTLLTTSWNTTTIRNFSRLRWDADNGQLIANLAVGGRVVYDLATGQELAVAANVTFDPRPSSDGVVYGRIVVGGRSYPCQSNYTYGYRDWFTDRGSVLPGIYPEYDVTNRAIYLSLEGVEREHEAIQMVEDHVTASTYHFRGWAPGCRYFAASLGIPGQDATDTVVWDVVENRRVGAFEDARQIEHPIYWSSDGRRSGRCHARGHVPVGVADQHALFADLRRGDGPGWDERPAWLQRPRMERRDGAGVHRPGERDRSGLRLPHRDGPAGGRAGGRWRAGSR